MTRNPRVWVLVATIAAAVAIEACGSSSTSPSSSSSSSSSTSPTSPTTTPAGAVATTTITITNNTVSPKDIIVSKASRVTFINNDTRPHNMTSDPHPEHTDCIELNSVGVLSPGQTRTSDNLSTVSRAVCGFHDHDNAGVTTLWGSVTVQ